MKEVTAAIIIKDNKVLIAQRAPDDKLVGKCSSSAFASHKGFGPTKNRQDYLQILIAIKDVFGVTLVPSI